jgi:hypothetical protein
VQRTDFNSVCGITCEFFAAAETHFRFIERYPPTLRNA